MDKLKQQWLGVLAVVVIVILGVLYGEMGTRWGTWGMLSAFGVGVLLVVSSFLVYWLSHTQAVLRKFQEEFQTVLKELRGQVQVFTDIYMFLTPDDALMEIERKANEIWVMTPNLYYEREDPDWRKLIFENVERGAKYVYFIEKDLEMEFNRHLSEIQQFLLAKNKRIAEDQILVKLLDIIVPTEVVFYDPNSGQPKGYVVTPIEGAKTNMRMSAVVRDRALTLLNKQG